MDQKRRIAIAKRLSVPMILLSSLGLSYSYADAYTRFVTSSAARGLGLNLALGAIPRGLGSYMDQAYKGDAIDWRLIGKWTILGAIFHGIIMFSLYYPAMDYLGLLPRTRMLVHFTFFTLVVNHAFHFWAQKRIISESNEKWKWSDLFLPISNMHSFKSSLKLWIVQVVLVGSIYWVGWNKYPQYMNLFTLNTAILWSWLYINGLKQWADVEMKPKHSVDGPLQGQKILGLAA